MAVPHRSRDRSRSLRRRSRLRPDRGDQGAAPLSRRGGRAALQPARDQPDRPSCKLRPASPGVSLVGRPSPGVEARRPGRRAVDRPRRRVGPQQVERDGGQTTSGSLVGASTSEHGDVGPVVEADLDPDRAPLAGPARAQARRAPRLRRAASASSSARSATSTSKVVSADCDLVSRTTLSGVVVLEPRPGAAARRPCAVRRPPRDHRGRRSRSAASVQMPILLSLASVFGPIPGTRPGELSAPKRSSASLAGDHDKPGRLAQLAGDLCQQAVLGDPDRAAQPGLSRISAAIRRIVAFGEKIPLRSI